MRLVEPVQTATIVIVEDEAGARSVDSRVAAVRRKLGADVLRTAQGIGYAFGSPGAPERER